MAITQALIEKLQRNTVLLPGDRRLLFAKMATRNEINDQLNSYSILSDPLSSRPF